MSVAEDSNDGEVQVTTSKLTEGLKSCRAMVKNYRALLSPDPIADAPADDSVELIEPVSDASTDSSPIET